MDGQGSLNDQALMSALKLTNLVLLNFHYQDLNDINGF